MVIFIILVQLFSTFFISRHINELLKLCGVPKSIIFANLKEESGNFDFHTRGYCCVVCCHFLSDNRREKRSMPLTGLRCCVRVLKILAVPWLKTAALGTDTSWKLRGGAVSHGPVHLGRRGNGGSVTEDAGEDGY